MLGKRHMGARRAGSRLFPNEMGGDDKKFLEDMLWAKYRTTWSNYTAWEGVGPCHLKESEALGNLQWFSVVDWQVKMSRWEKWGEHRQGDGKFFWSMPHPYTCFAKASLLDPPCLEDTHRRALHPVTVESTTSLTCLDAPCVWHPGISRLRWRTEPGSLWLSQPPRGCGR